MTIEEIREWVKKESEWLDHDALTVVIALLSRVDELETRLAGRTYFHDNEAVEQRVTELEAALRESIRVYQVDDMAYDPEADVERIFQRYVEGGGE